MSSPDSARKLAKKFGSTVCRAPKETRQPPALTRSAANGDGFIAGAAKDQPRLLMRGIGYRRQEINMAGSASRHVAS